MRRIFISYRRTEPDSTVALAVCDALKADGHDAFIDRDIPGGALWARTIESNVRGADFFIVLLSAASVVSDSVRGEIDLAFDQRSKEPHPRPTVLPVRVDFAGHLPYPLNGHLNQMRWLFWNSSEADATGILIQDLRDSMDGRPVALHDVRVHKLPVLPWHL